MAVQGDHAVVVGGSVAGLMAARVLSDHFEQVTVVERDVLPEEAEHRRGVPQSYHLHGLLYGGRLTLDELYGDFTDAMRAAGGPYFDFHRHQAYCFPEGWLRRAPSDLMVVYASRWTMEHVIRTLTRRIGNVEFRHGTAIECVASADRRRVTGVRLHDQAGNEPVLRGDLVVDAAGRASKAPKWLEDLGYAPPRESVVQPHLGYATVYCRIPDEAWPGDIKSIAAAPFPGTTRGGFAVPQEDGLVGIMAAGTSRDYPPGDEHGFTQFLRTAFTPIFHELWEAAEPVTEIKTTKTSVNRLRRWNELTRRPERFIPIGDAVAAYNPVYGQGVTTAALQAKALRERLREGDDLDAVVDQFYTDANAVCAFAWSAATESDMTFPATDVKDMDETVSEEEAKQYFRLVRGLTVTDAYVAQEFYRAMGLMKPEMLFTPEIRERVERAAAQPEAPIGDISRPPAFADEEVPVAA